MAKTGINNEIKTGVDLAGEKSARFGKLLGLFPEKDQNFLISAPSVEFSAFLEKGGFPAEELLDARESWISSGGHAQAPAQQIPGEKEEQKEHDNQMTRKQLEDLKKELKQSNPAATRAQSKEPLWGPKANYSEPKPRPTITRQTFSQRMPNLGIQRRTISGINRGARSMRRFSKTGSKIAGKAAQAGSKLAARGATALLSNPIGWLILAIIAVVIIVILLLFFFTNNTETGEGATCDTGICYYLDGPEQVANGEDICYQITLIYDPTKTITPVNNISVYDDYPESMSTFSSATGIYTPSSPSTEVTWQLSQNPSTSPSDALSGCPSISPSASPTTGQSGYYFKIKISPTVTDTSIENIIGVRIQ